MKAGFPFVLCATMAHAAMTEVDLAGLEGVFDPAKVAALAGAKPPPTDRNFAAVRDGSLLVTLKKGKKVRGTGLALHVPVAPLEVCELSFQIRYPASFAAGLHGKQLGMSGGKGYDGGRGEEARLNGDGWSVRLQFDATAKGIRNSLYVYHQGMKGRYGEPLGAGGFMLRRGAWHQLRLRVTAQSAPAARDGLIEVWCDGEKKITKDGLQLVRNEEGRCASRVRLEMFPGGGGEFPRQDEVVEIRELVWGAPDSAPIGVPD